MAKHVHTAILYIPRFRERNKTRKVFSLWILVALGQPLHHDRLTLTKHKAN